MRASPPEDDFSGSLQLCTLNPLYQDARHSMHVALCFSWERIGGDLQPYGRSCPLEETELKQDAFAGSTGRDVRLFVSRQDEDA